MSACPTPHPWVAMAMATWLIFIHEGRVGKTPPVYIVAVKSRFTVRSYTVAYANLMQ